MFTSVPPAFGKRGASAAAVPSHADDIHAAFFAAARAELADAEEHGPLVVPFSRKAASLAGLVVGCALAGFDIRGAAGARELTQVASALHTQIDTSAMVPGLVALGLFGGARLSAVSAILVHAVLATAGLTSRLAYAIGGAVAAAGLAEILLATLGHPPPHGWAVEIACGAGAGFLYRVIAGARPA